MIKLPDNWRELYDFSSKDAAYLGRRLRGQRLYLPNSRRVRQILQRAKRMYPLATYSSRPLVSVKTKCIKQLDSEQLWEPEDRRLRSLLSSGDALLKSHPEVK